MLFTTKPNRCKHCKVRMPEDKERHVLHDECVEPWLAKQLAKLAEAKKKKARAEDRVKRAALKRIPDLIAEAQKAFNAYIRERDKNQPCICCNKPLGAGEVGGAFDCGHYRSTGSASHLRFDPRNAHAQRKHCNRYGAGRAVDYRIGLIARIGVAEVEALESSNEPHKWTRDELIAIKNHYKARLKALNTTPKGKETE